MLDIDVSKKVTDLSAEAEAEWPHPPDLRDFLLQSSDEEDMDGFELSDPHLDSEAEVLAYFCKNQPNARLTDLSSQKYSRNLFFKSTSIHRKLLKHVLVQL